MNAITHTAPDHYRSDRYSVFLAGSIDQGQADDWQTKVCSELAQFPIALLNPRRVEWDATVEQSITNKVFREQVEWELDALDQANLLLFHFAASGPAPITLLELGLYASTVPELILVSAEPGYWRRGNIEVVCDRYEIPLFDNLDDLIEAAEERIIENDVGLMRSVSAVDTPK